MKNDERKTKTIHNETAKVVTSSMTWQVIPIEMHITLFSQTVFDILCLFTHNYNL